MLTLVKVFAFVAFLSAASYSENCSADDPPDGTDTALYFSECDQGTPHQLEVTSVSVTNADGTPNYPINITNAINLDVKSMNNGPEIDQLLANVSLYSWDSKIGGGCHWISVPTFGLLNNINECFNCPLPANSPVDLVVTIDLSAYSSIISLLLGGGIYGMDIHLKTDKTSTVETACVHVEAKVAK